MIYGPGLALLWILALLAFEVLLSRRAWCRYVCPIGITYGLVGVVSPLRVQYNMHIVSPWSAPTGPARPHSSAV